MERMLAAHGDRRPRRLLVAVLAGGVLLAWLAGCAGEPPRRPRFEDFVIEGGMSSDRGEPEPADEIFCADEHRFAQAIRPGETLRVTTHLGASPRLVLSSCRRRPRGEEPRPGELRIAVRAVDSSAAGGPGAAAAIVETLPVPVYSRWDEYDLDLSALADREVTLSLSLSAPLADSGPLFLRELWIEHRPVVAPAAPPRGERPRQVLLISVDTLREDAISALGGSHSTPALDAFAAQAQLFTPHYAAAAWTQPSHAALLTGQPHAVHGATDGKTAIHPAVPLLAERFHDAGFATAGRVFDCLWLDPRFGFGRGFDDYRSVHWTLPQTARWTLDWIDEHRAQPFFFFLHTFEAHSDFRRLPYEGPGVRQNQVRQRFGVDGYGCRQGHCASVMLMKINAGEIAPIAREAEILRYLYDRGVDHLDFQLGVLFGELQRRGLFDNLLIVLTSDHGEAFLEHGRVLHGHSSEEVLRVPLMIKWPAGERAGERVEVASGSLDVAPTLLRAAGLPAEGLPGRDLRRLTAARPIFVGSNFEAVIDGRFKAVIDPRDGGRLLFDLAADPGELHNLAGERPAEMARLEALLRERAARERRRARQLDAASDRQREMSPEEIERLRALGYVGQ
jgi:arylsulfatase